METVDKYVTLSVDDVLYMLHFVPGLGDTDGEKMLRIYGAVAMAAGAIAPIVSAPTMTLESMPVNTVGMSSQQWRTWLSKQLTASLSGKYSAVDMNVVPTPILFAGNKKIDAIKMLRAMTGSGLKEAKDAVESKWTTMTTFMQQDLHKWIALASTQEIEVARGFFDFEICPF